MNKLNKYIKQLNHNKDNIDYIQGQEIISTRYAEANLYQKNIWLILTILILLGLFRSLLSDTNDTIVGSILIIILIFILYFILKTYYN
jgi:hypothetical protein